ncbi:hypothetical protein HK103_006595 [Boothiomyces macroporosus]|uniref:Intracellular septation protein A n=1 Tax=Boothiomyces macroporosus TaxID=261099 RepID=A0AAD5Y6Z0_9FUNG|nr:hypothetical protein HK103_006595 [Boothiomyces macroporosus]
MKRNPLDQIEFTSKADFIDQLYSPLVLYTILEPKTSVLIALIISGIPSVLDGLYYIIVNRKIDAIAFIVILSILFSVGVVIISSDPKLILVKDSITTLFFATGFWSSLLFEENLLWRFYRQLSGKSNEELDDLWSHELIKSVTRFMCIVWGTGLVCEAFTRIYLIYHIDTVVLGYISLILLFGTLFSLTCWNYWYVGYRSKLYLADPDL